MKTDSNENVSKNEKTETVKKTSFNPEIIVIEKNAIESGKAVSTEEGTHFRS
jgi:hypothetical protein